MSARAAPAALPGWQAATLRCLRRTTRRTPLPRPLWSLPSSVRFAACCSCLHTHSSLNSGGNAAEEWWKVSSRTVRTVCCSCFSHERSRRSRRLLAAPLSRSTSATCQPQRFDKSSHKKKGATMRQTACCCFRRRRRCRCRCRYRRRCCSLLLLLLFWTRAEKNDVYEHTAMSCNVSKADCTRGRTPGVRLPASPPPLEPSTTNNCWPSRAEKSPKTPGTQLLEEESEKCCKCNEKPLQTPPNAITTASHR